MDDLELLRLDVAAAFWATPDGRLARARAHPPGPWATSPRGGDGPGPRFYFAGCPAGNVIRLGAGLDDELAGRIGALAGEEPPWCDADAPPHCLAAIVTLLEREAPTALTGPEIVFRLPNHLAGAPDVARCDADGGRELVLRLQRGGMPPALVDAGFLGLEDFWWPWCVVLQAGEIAAMAFATRLAAKSAEVGVYAFPKFRGRGCATVATAAWSSLAPLQDRALIYATRATNQPSRRVAARLGLAAIGARLWIA